MQKYIHKIDKLPELFDKLSYETKKFGASYTAVMFELHNKNRLNEFWEFLLHYLRISDTVFKYSETRLVVVLEETSIRWAILLNDKLRDKIDEKWFKYHFFCSAIQWDFLEDSDELLKALKKRIKISKNCDSNECIHSLSCMG